MERRRAACGSWNHSFLLLLFPFQRLGGGKTLPISLCIQCTQLGVKSKASVMAMADGTEREGGLCPQPPDGLRPLLVACGAAWLNPKVRQVVTLPHWVLAGESGQGWGADAGLPRALSGAAAVATAGPTLMLGNPFHLLRRREAG